MNLNKIHPFEKMLKEYFFKFKNFTTTRFKIMFSIATFFLLVSFSFVVGFFAFIYPAPSDFPAGEIISIPEGSSLFEIASKFEKENIITSAFWLENLIRIFGDDSKVIAGNYFFEEEKNIFEILKAIGVGNSSPDFIKITIPEGATVSQIGQICKNRLKDFDKEEFLSEALSLEGFLFPDTYYFPPSVSEEKVLATMNQNFNEKISQIEEKIKESEKTLEEIITMASLLEKEAITYESKKIIAGILWKRLEIGMKLQVDAVFGYINGKNTFDLTMKDLAHDSPYNTYKYKGLPSGPIANPGMESIEATLNPVESEYLFYLSDMQSKMHYSETYEEHMRKRRLYLN